MGEQWMPKGRRGAARYGPQMRQTVQSTGVVNTVIRSARADVYRAPPMLYRRGWGGGIVGVCEISSIFGCRRKAHV